MTAALSEQCTATAKSTGERCTRRVIGGGVCRFHGGAAPQVRAPREIRVAAVRRRAYGDIEERTPAEALLAASSSLDAALQRLETLAGDGDGAGPILLGEIRKAASESARVAKLVQDAGLDERRMALEEREQSDLGSVIGLALAAFGVDADDAEVRRAVVEAVERVRSGDRSPLPSRVRLLAISGGSGKSEAGENANG